MVSQGFSFDVFKMQDIGNKYLIQKSKQAEYTLMSNTFDTDRYLQLTVLPKIKKSAIIGEKANGGLKMVDFGLMEIALKIAWIQRIRQNSDAAWKVIPEYALSHLGGFAFLLDCRYDLNLLQPHDLPPFCVKVLARL